MNVTKRTHQPASAKELRIVFISSCPADWGGSEELWAGTALWLARAGHKIHVFKAYSGIPHPRLAQLRAAGCTVTNLTSALTLLARVTNRLKPYHRQYTAHKASLRILQQALVTLKPHLTVICQGSNYDGFTFADVCRRQGFAYVLLSQKATEFVLPHQLERTAVQQVYLAARRCFFVSRHNLALTELQLGMALPTAEVVWNSYNVPFQGELPWPAEANGLLRLACVARLDVLDKGQDILVQVMAQEKWKQRPLHVTLYGDGRHESAIRGMVDFLGLHTHVSFGGHVADVSQIWRTHHALLLPSRHEGLPLALVEAMLSGRPAIAANVGGVAELLVDNETGFLAAAPTPLALDEALERAWAARAAWPQLGEEAARQARIVVPADALQVLAHKLLAVAQEAPQVSG